MPQTIKVTKETLRDRVTKNRENHRKIFEEAVEGYKEQATQLLEKHIEEIRSGKMTVISIHLPAPEDHTRDYDRVLEMVKIAVGDEIELTEKDVAQYIMDDWQWKRHFLETASPYSATAAYQAESGGYPD